MRKFVTYYKPENYCKSNAVEDGHKHTVLEGQRDLHQPTRHTSYAILQSLQPGPLDGGVMWAGDRLCQAIHLTASKAASEAYKVRRRVALAPLASFRNAASRFLFMHICHRDIGGR